MGKAKLGVLLGGAYALGLAILLVVGLALPCGTLARVRPAVAAVPQHVERAVQMARVAVHAGALGVKHLPTALGAQGATPPRKLGRFCEREVGVGSWIRKCISVEAPQDAAHAVFVHAFLFTDDG